MEMLFVISVKQQNSDYASSHVFQIESVSHQEKVVQDDTNEEERRSAWYPAESWVATLEDDCVVYGQVICKTYDEAQDFILNDQYHGDCPTVRQLRSYLY